jgi:hypothetical protein
MTSMKDHYVPGDGLDKAGEWVWHFQLEARNLSKVSLLQKLVMEAFEKGYWRKYTFGTGRETWRACEFDYFLIASDIAYADASAVFTWKDRGRALAAATTSADPKKRRPLEQASTAWHSPTPETLAQRAARLGWVSATGVRSAAPRRARAYVRHGVSMDKHARDIRKQQVRPRREQLDQVIAQIVKRAKDETELRYIIDELQKRVGKRGRPSSDRQQWARDIETFKSNAKTLAKHWNLSQNATYTRIRQATNKSRFIGNRRAS